MIKKIFYTVMILLVFIAAWIVAGEFMFSPDTGGYEEQENSKITLRYQAEKEFMPGKANIILGVQTEAEKISDAFAENNRKMNQITVTLNETENVDISTLNFQVNPRREKDDEIEKIVYSVTNQIEVTTENLDNLGAIIKNAIEAGANQVLSIRYLLDDEEKAREEVIAEAIHGIREKITYISRELGQEEFAMISMNINDNYITRNNFRYTTEAPPGLGQEQAIIPPISPQQIKIEVNINATYSLK